ncbi:SGNH/GDSL hydrolase family protein [Dyella tabacisoli]|uniref:SGNH/GDSL hydrolase family protein n=1 Tax=Dyella tabacisoli TaxID=2282381 RepID=A0A369UJ26_9GAMM|nr:SGNH/GDSL hydrolase family protein [Dyella tabacisoli]RDD80353.1 SGNH/GDSL hydrolase family protein [Dyella tabacisoli]
MTLHYLALGDSYSIGEGVPASGRWPMQLAARLRREGIPLADPQIIATTGWTTDELSAAMDHATLAPPYDLVSLLIGVNNQYRGRGAGEYRQEFQRLLAGAICLAGGCPQRVLVLSIPDWGATTFGHGCGRDIAHVAYALDVFNAIARDEVQRARACWVDVTGLSRQQPQLLAEDGLHPSVEQYGLWVDVALPVVRGVFR